MDKQLQVASALAGAVDNLANAIQVVQEALDNLELLENLPPEVNSAFGLRREGGFQAFLAAARALVPNPRKTGDLANLANTLVEQFESLEGR